MSHGLLEAIRTQSVRTGVIGLGYVGLPLLVEFAKAGFQAIGVDIDQKKVDAIEGGESYIDDVPEADIVMGLEAKRLRATTDFTELASLDTINICVPTPLTKTKDPDLSYVLSAVSEVAKHLCEGQLVILESTTYPGTVHEVVQPKLEETGLRAGHDFFLAFSPERVDPGNAKWTTRTIPKVVGGVDRVSTELAAELYGQVVETVVPVSSTQVAEMVKLIENTFRAVNIGLANELALMCRGLDVDVWEVIEAAKTKPFGFMPFYPGPGLGGHCIPIDPFYLSWKARQSGFESRFIELAGHVNASMPHYVVERVADALNSQSKAVNGSRVHLFGMAYKADVGDIRESPALDIARMLVRRGAIVEYTDSFVPTVQDGDLCLTGRSMEDALAEGVDCAVITTDHRGVDYEQIAQHVPLVVDTRNVLKGGAGGNVFRL